MNWLFKLSIIVAIALLFVPHVAAKPIQMPEYWTEYQDWQENTYRYTNENLLQHPLYLKTENSTHYILQRGEDVLTIQKNIVYNGTFNFGISDISFTIVAPASKVQNVSVANGSGQRRIKIPESAKSVYKRFQWDNKLPLVVLKNQTWNKTVLQSDYWYSRQNGNLWFNFKTVNVTGLSADVSTSFYFNSWIIDNTTTSGWQASNISTNGYWSAYGGGSIGTPLNQSIHTNLSLYDDCEATSGTIQYGINRYGRFPNSSIQGTWSGNTTLNYTAGQNWGNACSFDGVNDYILSAVADEDLNTYAVRALIYPDNVGEETRSIVSHGASPTDDGWTMEQFGTNLRLTFHGVGNYDSIAGVIGLATWQPVLVTKTGTTASFYVNDSAKGTASTGSMVVNSHKYGIGGTSGGVNTFNGDIDEVIITNTTALIFSNSTYATSYYLNISNQTASAGKVISAVRFNVPYLNSLNNTANISIRQNGTSSWTQVNTTYQNWSWVNFTGWAQTDILFEGFGNGSSRMFLVSGEIDETNYIPPVPTINSTHTGNFYVNTSWIAGLGNITDSYNSTNGTTWVNSTSMFRNTTLSAHAWQNLTIYAYNTSSGTLNSTPLTNNTQIPNNLINISGIQSSYTLFEGETLNIDADYTDADSDTGTFDRNFNKGTFNTGTGILTWVTENGENGIYNLQINVSDGYGSVSTANFTITIEDVTTSKGGGSSFIPYIPTTTTIPTTTIPTSTSSEIIEQFIPSSSPYQVQKPLDMSIYSIQFTPSLCSLPVVLNKVGNNISVTSQCIFNIFNINFIVPKNMEVVQLINDIWTKPEQQIVAMTPNREFYIIQVTPESLGIFTFTEKSIISTMREQSVKDMVLYIDKTIYDKLISFIQIISDPNVLKNVDKSLYDNMINEIEKIKLLVIYE